MALLEEGQSPDLPPYFNGENYYHWKPRMRSFIQSKCILMWKVITEGNYQVEESKVEELSSNDRKKIEANYGAIHVLLCALGPTEYNRVCSLETAQDIWKCLEMAHEGNKQLKSAKINYLVTKLQLFRMKDNESVDAMYNRLITIVNELRFLGYDYPESELVWKVIRSLTREWDSKRTIIEEGRDLETLKLDDLMGSLKSYELMVRGRKLREQSELEMTEKVLKMNEEEFDANIYGIAKETLQEKRKKHYNKSH